MTATQIKSRTRKNAGIVEGAVDTAAADVAGEVEALAGQRDVLKERLRDIGRKLRDRSRIAAEEASEQARLHPLAAIGVAFVAGLLVARALRR